VRELDAADGADAVLGGGVLACGGGGWRHHGELMASVATSVGTPVLSTVAELPPDSWVATVTAIGAPAAKDWEIRPLDYVHALQRLMEVSARDGRPIAAVMTAQNGYSTSVNGWIQSAVVGLPVLDAAGDVRAHPTGKLGALGLTTRPGYTSVQVVSGGNRELHGHFESVVRGSVVTCDDVLRDISVRTGGFIASARNPVELSWVRDNAALGAITVALELGAAMRKAEPGDGVIDAVCAQLGARELGRGPLGHAVPLRTHGGWDHGTFAIGELRVPYLNEYMAVLTAGGQRLSTYPDTIAVLRLDDGLPLAVKDAVEGLPVAVVVAPATSLPLSTSAVDVVALREVEEIMDLPLVEFLP
jgi:DUF917 family protein